MLSAFNLVGAVIGVAVGALSDRFGQRNVIAAGLALTALASAAGAAADGAPLLLLSRLFEGLGFMAVVVAVPGLLVRIVRPNDRGLVFGIWGGYMPAGVATMIVLTPNLLSILAGAGYGWRMPVCFWLVR